MLIFCGKRPILLKKSDGEGDSLVDLCQMQPHGGAVAPWQHQPGTHATLGADGAEDVGRCGALVGRRRRTAAALRPASGDFVLLADPRFVLEPDLYRLARCIACGDFRQACGEVFLKAATAATFCAWCRGRADSLR